MRHVIQLTLHNYFRNVCQCEFFRGFSRFCFYVWHDKNKTGRHDESNYAHYQKG